ncbi:MAG: tetratricopeptide repeat protein [Candidatus Omnitrophica bacterium]|nr:tetratricopeptide repeat protein [Candidatus Omnitrophota bacterium]
MKNAFCVSIILLSVLSAASVQAQSNESLAQESRRQGIVFQNQGEYRKALFYYQRAQMFQPDSAVLFNDAGLMYEYSNMKKEAEESYRKSISLDPKYLPAYSNLGVFYSKQGQYAMAARYLRRRVELGKSDDPWTLAAQEELNKVYRQAPALRAEGIRVQADDFAQKIVEAKEKMKRTAERNQTMDFEAVYLKGIQYLEARQFDQAVDMLNSAVVINPRSVNARQALKRAEFGRDKSLLETQAGAEQKQVKGSTVTTTLDKISSP